jgi:hypothetical protein
MLNLAFKEEHRPMTNRTDFIDVPGSSQTVLRRWDKFSRASGYASDDRACFIPASGHCFVALIPGTKDGRSQWAGILSWFSHRRRDETLQLFARYLEKSEPGAER